MTTATQTSLMNVVDELAPLIVQHAGESERERRLSPAVFQALRDAGLFGLFVPQELGGLEYDLIEGFEVMERISRLDSAAGWNLQILATGVTIGALLPDDGAREVFGGGGVVAGGFNPPGAAVASQGGYILNGRWPFASGCQNASWFVDTALLMEGGHPQMGPHGPIMLALVYPANEGSIVESWNSLGMRGTGSHELVAEDIFVPARRVAALRPFDEVGSAYQGPLYKLGIIPTIMGNAVVALGVARAAIDEAVEQSKTRTPAFMQTPPLHSGVVHGQLARAEATLSSARSYFYEALGNAWGTALGGHRPTNRDRLHVQLAASHAAAASAAAVDLVHAAVGSSGIQEAQYRFARHFRDAHTITQHAVCSAARFESMGQVMLGLETEWPFFSF